MTLATSARPPFRAQPLGRRLRHWSGAADAGVSQWQRRRSQPAKAAGMAFVLVIVVGSFFGREHLAADTTTWALLTTLNAGALALALVSLSRARSAPVLEGGILSVFVVGGILQLFLLAHNLTDGELIRTQVPHLSGITSADIAEVYGLMTLAFVICCLVVAVVATVAIRPRLPRTSRRVDSSFPTLLVAATIAYALLTTLQIALGFGRNALQNPSLPFPIIPATLFFRLQVFPALLLLGAWVYDRSDRRISYLCVAGIGAAALSDAFISTHRGAIVNYGLPVLFLWLLTGRFTRFRKMIVASGLMLFLLIAPMLSALRVERVREATGAAGSSVEAPRLLSEEALNVELGRLLLRVGGTSSTLLAINHQDELSLGGLLKVYRPYGLTEYFTYEVAGVPLDSVVAQGRAPTLVGMGTLIGGPGGIVVVVVLTLVGLTLAQRWVMRRFWSWPVGLAILAHGALLFFSEGVTILLYKSVMAVGVTEVIYRLVARRPARLAEGVGAGQKTSHTFEASERTGSFLANR